LFSKDAIQDKLSTGLAETFSNKVTSASYLMRPKARQISLQVEKGRARAAALNHGVSTSLALSQVAEGGNRRLLKGWTQVSGGH